MAIHIYLKTTDSVFYLGELVSFRGIVWQIKGFTDPYNNNARLGDPSSAKTRKEANRQADAKTSSLKKTSGSEQEKWKAAMIAISKK